MKKAWKKTCLLAISCLALGAASLLGACGGNDDGNAGEKQVYYETQIRFYVNPENPTMSADGSGLNTSGSEYGVYGAYGEHIMDNMVKLLNEDAFAEEMLLRSQDTSAVVDNPDTDIDEKEIYKYLPMKDVWTDETEEELATELNIEIEEASYYMQAVLVAEGAFMETQEEYLFAVDIYRDNLLALKSVWNRAFLTSYGEYSEEKYENLTGEDKQHEQFCYVEEAYLETRLASETLNAEIEKLNIANKALQEAKRNAESPCTEVFVLWEQTAKYKNLHAKYSEATHFTFLISDETTESGNTLARSFIYANISVKGEENLAFAEEVYEIVKEVVPEYVEANMAIPAGYTGTNCQRISRDDAPRKIEK